MGRTGETARRTAERLARHERMVELLERIAEDETQPAMTRVAAADKACDRLLGRPPQRAEVEHSGSVGVVLGAPMSPDEWAARYGAPPDEGDGE